MTRGLQVLGAAAVLVSADPARAEIAGFLSSPLNLDPPAAPASTETDRTGLTPQRGQGVIERSRPDVAPIGARVGSFFFYPRIDTTIALNDNIFATQANRRADVIATVSPELNLKSGWASHQLQLRAGGAIGSYVSTSSENFVDGFAAADARYDLAPNVAAVGSARIEHLHTDRSSTDNPGNEAKPIEYDVFSAKLGLDQRAMRIGYSADLSFRREQYDTVAAIGGGTLDLSARTVNDVTPTLKISYEVAPLTTVFVRGSGSLRTYDDSTGGDPAVPKRDSVGFRLDVGMTVDVTGVTFAEVFAGFLKQDYDDARFGSISGLDGGARVVWNATELTTLSLTASRRIQDSNTTALSTRGLSIFSPGYLRSSATLAVDHELLRHLLLRAEASLLIDDYAGINRTDRTVDLGLGARYFVNRTFDLGAGYNFTRRQSSGDAAIGAFSRNVLMFRVGAQF